MSDRTPRSIDAILDDIDEAADCNEEVSIADVMQHVGSRAFGPLIAFPALLAVSPLGAIPTVPTILAVTSAIFAVQVAAGRKDLWMPDALGQRSISAEQVHNARRRLQPWADRLDRWFHARLPLLSRTVSTRIAAACCLLLCLTVPPLEMVPFAAAIPLAVVTCFGLAMALRDGLLMLLAYLLMAAALLTPSFVST